MKYIVNGDLGLHSVNMIDVNVDIGFLKYGKWNKVKSSIIEKLNANRSMKYLDKLKFTYESIAETISKQAINSAGSITVTRGKVYIAYASLNEIEINQDTCDALDRTLFLENKVRETSFVKGYKHIKEYLKKQELVVLEPELKFGAFGEVLFFARVQFRNEKISMDNYHSICMFLFEFVRAYYMGHVIEACNIYLDTILKIQKQKHNEIRLLDSFHSSIFERKDSINYEEVARRCFHSFTWSHYIFSSEEFKSVDIFKAFDNMLKFDSNLSEENIFRLHDARAFIGWSHSVFVSTDLTEEQKRAFVHFYKIPIEIEWGEWEFLRNLNRKAEKSLYESYEILNKKFFFMNKIGSYSKSVNNFYFYSRRIIEDYEGISLSVNPTQILLKEKQRCVWKLDINKIEFLTKLESLQLIIEHLRERKKDINSRILNSILFIIALLSVVDISNTIYNIISSQNTQYMYFTLLPATSTFLIALIMYRILKD